MNLAEQLKKAMPKPAGNFNEKPIIGIYKSINDDGSMQVFYQDDNDQLIEAKVVLSELSEDVKGKLKKPRPELKDLPNNKSKIKPNAIIRFDGANIKDGVITARWPTVLLSDPEMGRVFKGMSIIYDYKIKDKKRGEIPMQSVTIIPSNPEYNVEVRSADELTKAINGGFENDSNTILVRFYPKNADEVSKKNSSIHRISKHDLNADDFWGKNWSASERSEKSKYAIRKLHEMIAKQPDGKIPDDIVVDVLYGIVRNVGSDTLESGLFKSQKILDIYRPTVTSDDDSTYKKSAWVESFVTLRQSVTPDGTPTEIVTNVSPVNGFGATNDHLARRITQASVEESADADNVHEIAQEPAFDIDSHMANTTGPTAGI